jgi:tetratricopeptide (TPR) repeat protein
MHESGQLAAAEQLIEGAAADSRNEHSALLALLVPIASEEGRLDEAVRLIEARWEHLNGKGEGSLEPAIKLVLLHIELTLKPTPVETVRAYLTQAARLAPMDDRVWLGQANLAIRTRDHDAAKRLLDACLERRPHDVSVWRARLSWAVETDRIDVVQEALTHLPSTELNPARLARLQAWLALKRGDLANECQALERVSAADPTDRNALDRLAQMAERDGEPARAAELFHKRVEFEQLEARYEKLYDRRQPVRNAEEMAHLAEKLGRVFEARALLTVAIAEDPDREDLRNELARLGRPPKRFAHGEQTLAEVIAHG